jgi:hypothetical protein
MVRDRCLFILLPPNIDGWEVRSGTAVFGASSFVTHLHASNVDAPTATHSMSRSALCVAWLVSSALLACGLTLPVVEIQVNAQGVLQEALDQQPIIGLLMQEKGLSMDELASKLPPQSTTRQSVVSSVFKLFSLQCHLAATLVLMFSVLVPIGKQVVQLLAILAHGPTSDRFFAAASSLHKWAMLDVFVLAMVVLALSSATSWNALLQQGAYWFLAYFFTSALLNSLIGRRASSA